MAVIAGARALYRAQTRFRATAVGLYGDAATAIGQVLAAAADFDGRIPEEREADVVRAGGDVIQRLFVAADGRSAYERDGATATAPFGAALNQAVADVTFAVVRAHHEWLQRNAPADVFDWLARAQPVSEQARVVIDPTRVFTPNPLATYEPLHRWVDPNRYRLSDRVWQASVRTRLRVDALLADGIRNGVSARDLSRQVERFLLPTRAPLRTKRPYGVDGSYDGMRLARTEITRAHGAATLAAARANPYVDAIDWRLSAAHPRQDICDALAAAGPYPLDNVPGYPPHPHCLCVLVQRVSAAPAAVTDALRARMATGEPPPYVTPANERGFLQSLLGPILLALIESRLFG